MRFIQRRRKHSRSNEHPMVSAPDPRVTRACRCEVERLEPRCLFTTTFNGFISTPASAAANAQITVDLTVTGNTASEIDMDWNGDGVVDQVLNPGSAQTISATHTYPIVGTYPIVATFHPTGGGTPVVAADSLSVNFGNYPSNSTGLTVAAPSGGSGDLGGKSLVVDPVTGDTYVATPYSGQIAITRFTNGGQVDSSGWGTSGTLLIPSFDGGSDSPLGLYLRGQLLAVSGKGANGFAVAMIRSCNNIT